MTFTEQHCGAKHGGADSGYESAAELIAIGDLDAAVRQPVHPSQTAAWVELASLPCGGIGPMILAA